VTFGFGWVGLIWFSLNWLGLDWFDFVDWFGLVCFVCFGLV
jgi:hypothetical protein